MWWKEKIVAKDAAYQKALKKIKQVHQTNSGALNLSRMELAELPLEIAQLANLQWLNISKN